MKKRLVLVLLAISLFLQLRCQNDKPMEEGPDTGTPENFYFGADLSYVNQVLDKGGQYSDGAVKSPYEIFADKGVNLVRLRLWHNPAWTRDVYGGEGDQMYNDLSDVAEAIQLARARGMQVLLDFHYSDNWADPGKQEVPAAWKEITSLQVLKDSVYNYTAKVLSYLDEKELMPELVQLGNETNCGMLYTNAPAAFPSCNVCGDTPQWARLGEVINAAIGAVNDVKEHSSVDTKILLHVAEPNHVEWWFDNITGDGGVADFDMIGFSYYPLWHTAVSVDGISEAVSAIRARYARPVLILETAYPWTTEAEDDYNNLFGSQTPLANYPFSKEGQRDLLIKLTQEVIDGGGSGVVYWEPAWISVPALKDQWGTGSSWENATFFDFEGNTLPSFDFATHEYELP